MINGATIKKGTPIKNLKPPHTQSHNKIIKGILNKVLSRSLLRVDFNSLCTLKIKVRITFNQAFPNFIQVI